MVLESDEGTFTPLGMNFQGIYESIEEVLQLPSYWCLMKGH